MFEGGRRQNWLHMKEFSRYTNREIATLGVLKLVPEVTYAIHGWLMLVLFWNYS